MDDRDSNRSSSFEFEGNVEQPKEQTRNTTVSSEDLKAALKKPNTRTEQIAIAAEKTKGTARSLLDKSAKKINNIKSEKVRSAVIWGGGITALIVVVAVGILIGKAIHLAWLNNRTAETRAMIDSFNVEYNDIAILGASKEDKESFLSAVQEETKELESRDDENLWEMYMIEANAYFGPKKE